MAAVSCIVLEHQYGRRDVIWIRSNNVLGSAHEKFGVWTELEFGSTIAFYQTAETGEDLRRDKIRSSHETNYFISERTVNIKC